MADGTRITQIAGEVLKEQDSPATAGTRISQLAGEVLKEQDASAAGADVLSMYFEAWEFSGPAAPEEPVQTTVIVA